MFTHLEQKRMPSVFGTVHRNAVVMKNFFSQGVGGDIRLRTPAVWDTFPPRISFKMATGEEIHEGFEVQLPFTANSGRHDVRIDFDINADRRYRFSVYRDLQVGLGDVDVEVSTKLGPDKALMVELRMVNHSEKTVDFKCLLHAPDRRRMSAQVVRLGRGQDIKRFIYPHGDQLVGKTLWLRAEEIGGLRILNYRFDVSE